MGNNCCGGSPKDKNNEIQLDAIPAPETAVLDAESVGQNHHVPQPPPKKEQPPVPDQEDTIETVIQKYPGKKIIKALYDFEGTRIYYIRIGSVGLSVLGQQPRRGLGD